MRKGERLLRVFSSDESELAYADPWLIKAIRDKLPRIAEADEGKCQELQILACKAFVDLYREYLNPDQIEYLLNSEIIVGNPQDVEKILEEFFYGTRAQKFSTSELNGQLIRSYSFKTERNKSALNEEVVEAQHYWFGRLPVVPNSIGKIDPKYLRTKPDTMGVGGAKSKELWDEYYMDMKPIDELATTSFTAMSLHEKIHGCQKYDIPLPILETAAYYYEAETFKSKSWQQRDVNFDRAIKFWETLVLEFGTDLHRLVFGNLSEKKAIDLLIKIKKRFNPKKMKEIFESPSEKVIWHT